MRVVEQVLDADEAMRLILAYPIGSVAIYDCAGDLDAGPKRAKDEATVEDFGRMMALGLIFSRDEMQGLLYPIDRGPLKDIPEDLALSDLDLVGDRGLLKRVTDFYGRYRFGHRLGPERALAFLHMRRPELVPVLSGVAMDLYAARAASIGAKFSGGVPMFWEAIRQDVVDNAEEIQALQRRLEGEGDVLGCALSRLSVVRLHCIVSEQLVQSRNVG